MRKLFMVAALLAVTVVGPTISAYANQESRRTRDSRSYNRYQRTPNRSPFFYGNRDYYRHFGWYRGNHYGWDYGRRYGYFRDRDRDRDHRWDRDRDRDRGRYHGRDRDRDSDWDHRRR